MCVCVCVYFFSFVSIYYYILPMIDIGPQRAINIDRLSIPPTATLPSFLPVVAKDLPISPRFSPHESLSRYKFSALIVHNSSTNNG